MGCGGATPPRPVRTLGRWRPWCGRAVAAALLVAVSTVAEAQEQDDPYPIFTIDHLQTTMITMGPNFEAARRALRDEDYPFAKERFIRAREQLAITITFWRQNDRDDGVEWVREAITGLDEIDNLLSGETVDGDTAGTIAARVDRVCTSCHAVYRDTDPDTGAYRLKPGSID